MTDFTISPANWTEEEITLATQLHEAECKCGHDIWWMSTGWLDYARAIIKDRPQIETLDFDI